MVRRALAAAIFGLAGTAVLVGLGVWQLDRLAWKEALIARLEARLAAAPVALPAAPDPERDSLLRVRVEGRLGTGEADVLTSLRPWGPGFRVIAPLVTDRGRRVLVDLGYVPEAMKDPADRPGPPPGHVAVTGALYWPDETDSFTPPPDEGRNIWFARDLAPMAAALGTEPLLVVADAHDLGDWPKARRLGIDLPNDHLQYAITWLALAAAWAAMSVVLVVREWRSGSG